MNGIDAYLGRLASGHPTPGGGSAAALVGALGTALCAMVARITADAKRHAGVKDAAVAIAAEADILRERFVAAQTIDEAAYQRVVDASALPKETESEREMRTERLQQALIGAAEAPLAAAGLAAEGFGLALRAAELENAHLSSDVECALHFLRASLAASIANVRINHRYLRDAEVVREQDERLTAIAAAATDAEKRALARLERT